MVDISDAQRTDPNRNADRQSDSYSHTDSDSVAHADVHPVTNRDHHADLHPNADAHIHQHGDSHTNATSDSGSDANRHFNARSISHGHSIAANVNFNARRSPSSAHSHRFTCLHTDSQAHRHA